MTTAFVLGNGRSRKGINLEALRSHGRIYGCNALYREFTPDVLVTADRAISEHIQHSGYGNQNTLYTRKPLPGLGAQRIHDRYWGYSSGPAAAAIACVDRCTCIYLIGFDFGSTDTLFNNVYADTEFYKASSARPTYSGNWIRQIQQVARDFPHCRFVRVQGTESTEVKDFANISNISTQAMKDFCSYFGI